MKKLLVHVHLYYFEQLPYILNSLKNIVDCEWDLFVSVCDFNPNISKSILNFKPDAQIIKVENKGYDILPFLKIIRSVNLEDYDCVLKIHTKNKKNIFINLNGYKFTDNFWGEHLIDSYLKSKKIFKRNLQLIRTPDIGMVADSRFILRFLHTPDDNLFLDVLKNRFNIKSDYKYYLAGTMFFIKSDILKNLLTYQIDDDEFPSEQKTNDEATMAHVLERFFTVLTDYLGYKIYPLPNNDKLPKKFYNEFFSVILTVYNNSSGLEGKINNILNNTCKNYELVIVDQGSSDNTEEMLKANYNIELINKQIKFIKSDKKLDDKQAQKIGLKNAKFNNIVFDNKTINKYFPVFISETYKCLNLLGFKILFKNINPVVSMELYNLKSTLCFQIHKNEELVDYIEQLTETVIALGQKINTLENQQFKPSDNK